MALSAAMLLCMPAARAADTPVDMTDDAANAPEYDMQGEETHPPIRLTPDKPQIVNLDTDASSVIVGNPTHLNAIMDTTRSLVLVPRDPGATHLTVMGQNGKPIMERYVIIGAPTQKYIRIRRDCAGMPGTCEPESVYYCPDMCHETGILASKMGQMNTMPAPRPIPQNTSENKEGAAPANTQQPAPNAGQASPQAAPANNNVEQ
jgi:hypothetical protein